MAIEGLRSYYKENSTRYRMITEGECEKIILASFEIAETVGVDMKSAKARELMKRAGCIIEGHRVRIPAEVIKQAINAAPPEVILYDRNKKDKIHIKGANFYYGLGPTTPFFEDIYTGERRPSTGSYSHGSGEA